MGDVEHAAHEQSGLYPVLTHEGEIRADTPVPLRDRLTTIDESRGGCPSGSQQPASIVSGAAVCVLAWQRMRGTCEREKREG
jgi:hypothetical protein